MRQIFIFFAVYFFLSTSASAVPVINNESVVHGSVEEYSPVSSSLLDIQPEIILYKITVSITAVEATKGPDFLQEKVGQSVDIYSKQKQSSDLLFKKVKATVVYRGDKWHRLLWLKQIEIDE